MQRIKQRFMPPATQATDQASKLVFQSISDQDCEIIHGGKNDQLGRQDKAKDSRLKPWPGDKLLNQSLGNVLVINIYQINLAINTILGGNGNSIVNIQGNSSATA